jgi:hypothetical protein
VRALWVLGSSALAALALSGEQASAHLGTHHFFSPIFSGAANVERTLPDRAFLTRSIHVENEGGLTQGIPVPVSIGYASCNPKRTEQWLGHFFVPHLIGFLLSQHRHPCSILKIDPVHSVFADFLHGDKEGAFLNRDVLVRKDHYLQIVQMLTQRVLANLFHGVRFLGGEERGVSLAPGKGLLGGRMAYVPCLQIEANDDEGIHYANIDWSSPRESEPRSLSDIHLIELIAHNSQLPVHDLPLIVCKNCINYRGEGSECDERLHTRSDSKIIQRIQYVYARADQRDPGEPHSRHSIWLEVAICLLGLMFVEKGFQWISCKEKVIGVLGLFSLMGGIYLLWVFGLNVL